MSAPGTAPDQAVLLRDFEALPRDQQLYFLAKAMNAYAAGIKLNVQPEGAP